jgi:phage shock protein A
MMTPLQEAQIAVRQARQALIQGDRRLARQLAERAAKLAPQLEDPWQSGRVAGQQGWVHQKPASQS